MQWMTSNSSSKARVYFGVRHLADDGSCVTQYPANISCLLGFFKFKYGVKGLKFKLNLVLCVHWHISCFYSNTYKKYTNFRLKEKP